MNLNSRAFACLIVYFFLSFHAVTWAGDRGRGDHFDDSAHLQDTALVSVASSDESLASFEKKQLEQASQGQTLNAQDSQALSQDDQYFLNTYPSLVGEGDCVPDIYRQEELRLRGQVIEKQADPQAHYQYATYLRKHQLCSQSGMSYQNHLLIAAEAGHVEAARQLLNHFQPGHYPSAGSVFFQLYQLGNKEQFTFCGATRARFLAHAIEAGDIGALDYLDKLTYRTLKNNQKSGRKHRHPEWKNMLSQWANFENLGEQVNTLMTEINGMYRTGVHQRLSLLKNRCPWYQLDTDSEDEDSSLVCQQRTKRNKQAIEESQTELEMARSVKQPKLDADAQLEALNVEPQADCLQRQQNRERKAQEIVDLREQLARLPAKKEFQLSQPGESGFAVGAVPEGCLPADFSKLQGSEDIHSDEYGNYRHQTAGVHVWIPAFVYRIGKNASAFKKYGIHAIEVLDLGVYLACFDESVRAHLIRGFAQGQRGFADWQLHRAFVNAGAVQAGFFIQKYLASPHENGKSVTSVAGTVPLSLTCQDGFTRSKDMPGCQGVFGDAYVLAKQTSDAHQVASIFQYSALTMLSLAQAQGATSNQYCAWWSADPAACCPKGCVHNLGDDQKVDLVWESAGELGDLNKPRTGSCSEPAWTSHNGQRSGIADLKGVLWEAAGAVTTGSDRKNPKTLWALGRQVDYIAVNENTAFATEDELRARGDEPVSLPYQLTKQLDGTFALFSNDAAYDALVLPKSQAVKRKRSVWLGYDNGWLNTEDTFANLMPVVGGGYSLGDGASLCARHWCDHSDTSHFYDVGLRLSAYGVTWATFEEVRKASVDALLLP